MKFVVGTRGSRLSRVQTEQFLDQLKRAQPQAEFEIKIIKTLGDTEQNKPLFTIDSQGIFEKEIDQALINDEADFAVASLKDVPTAENPQTTIAAIPQRAAPNDALISRSNQKLKDLPKGAVIGTGSLRRLAQVKNMRPDLEVKAIRGNVDTRIQKVQSGEFDGIIIAKAGLERMHLTRHITEEFTVEEFPSAPGQGALAIVAKKTNVKVTDFLQAIEHKQTRAEVTAERSLMFELGGGCRVPIGAVGKTNGTTLTLLGVMFTLDGQSKIQADAKGTLENAAQIGKEVAQQLVEQGAKEIEQTWRKKYGPW
ncbi:MAG: hydroxymethylbilane synthase [Candidatus Bathyarchaeota archaeon]|nr:hydroxymethylbilane synthase [Candidatus Bathyarchaeota archaeon]